MITNPIKKDYGLLVLKVFKSEKSNKDDIIHKERRTTKLDRHNKQTNRVLKMFSCHRKRERKKIKER